MPARTAPWKQPRSRRPASRTRLTAHFKAKAKAAARRAGRRYPNLVDNMNAARQQRESGKARGATAGRRRSL